MPEGRDGRRRVDARSVVLVLLRLSVALFVLIGLTEMTLSQQASRASDMLDAAERGDGGPDRERIELRTEHADPERRRGAPQDKDSTQEPVPRACGIARTQT